MKKILFILVLMVLGTTLLMSQSSLQHIDSIQGIWYFKNENVDNYMWIKSNKKLSISSSEAAVKKFSIRDNPFSYIGLKEINDPLPTKVAELGKTGSKIVVYSDTVTGFDLKGNLKDPLFESTIVFNPDIEEAAKIDYFAIIGLNGSPNTYKRIDALPTMVLVSLKKDKKDWEKYVAFVKMKRQYVKAEKASIYNNEYAPTKAYLIKNDEVEILEEKGEWAKIRFFGNKVTVGWIKKEDLK